MSLVIANLGSSANPDINDSSDLSTYTNTSWTPSGDIVFVFCYSRTGGGAPNAPTVTGHGLTWTNISTVTSGAHRMSLIAAPAAGATTDVTVFDFAAQTQVGCTACFAKATDVELGSGILSAFVQMPNNSGGSGTAAAVTLATLSAANNVMIGGVGHQANEVTTPQATWTELDDLAGATPNRGVETAQRNGGATSNFASTWVTSSAWVAVGAEIAETLPVGPAKPLARRVGRPKASHRASRW